MSDIVNALMILLLALVVFRYNRSGYIEFPLPLGYQGGLDKFNKYNN